MRLRSAMPHGQLRKNPLTGLVFIALTLTAAYKLAIYIVVGDTRDLMYVGVAAVMAVLISAILVNWRNGLYFFLGWLLFEDLIRKYLGNNMIIYFAKDFLVAVVYIAFFLAYRRNEVRTFRPPFLIPVLLLTWFGLMQVFNPASTSIWYGILGMKLFFYYVPLVIVGYALIDSEESVRRFFTLNLIFALSIVSLGIAQSILGPTFLNPTNLAADIRELSTTYRVAPISGEIVYRPNGVFVSAGRFADFLVVIWMLVFGFSGYLVLRHKRGRILAFLALATTFAGVLLCASRGAFMWTTSAAMIGSAAFFWGAPWREREVMRVVRAVFRVATGIGLALILLFVAFPNALLGRMAVYSETLLPSSPTSELIWRGRDYPMLNFMGAFNYPRWPYGYGIGTTANGTQYVARLFDAKPPVVGVESGYGTLVVEMGIGGLILWIIMSIAILISAWKIVRKLKGSPWFPLAFMIFWYALILLVPMTFMGMQPYEDFILNAYLWILLGILFRLPTLQLSAKQEIVPTSRLLGQRGII